MELNPEQKIVLIISKKTGIFQKTELINLFSRNICWENIIKYATRNKVVYLLYDNIVKNGLRDYIPKYYQMLLDDSCDCNYLRNTEKLKELDKIQSEMKKYHIDFSPVKGAYLIDNVYCNRKIRITNDIDALIRKKDIKLINHIMLGNGYVQGDFDSVSSKIITPNTTKKMLYKTKMYNLLPYIKINNDIPRKTVIFDLSFSLDFSLNTSPVNEMLDCAVEKENKLELLPEHFFIHMCCHHYREASNVAWILIGKDLNLIKFCDVREFVLQKMDNCSIQNAILFAKKYGIEKAVYFTIYFVREIYNDGYETDILNSLDIKDEKFLYEFGMNDYDEIHVRKKDFWSSLFLEDNKDEIVKAAKYKKLID